MILIRRIISIFLLVLILAGIVYGLIWLRAGSLKVLDPERAVPPGTVLFLETHDFRQLSSTLRNHNDIWTTFMAYKGIDRLNRDLAMIDSVGRKYPDFNDLVAGNVIVSLSRADSGFHALFIVSAPHHKSTEQVLKLIPADAGIDKHHEENVTVYQIRFPQDSLIPGFSFFESKGLLVMSPSEAVLKVAAARLNSGQSLRDNHQFALLQGTTGSDAIANIYVNYPELGAFVRTLFRDGAAELVSKFAGWSALDLDIRPGFFTLNGFTTAGDSLHQSIRMLQGQQPVSFDFASVVPSGAVFFSFIGFSDPGLLLDHVQTYASNPARDRMLAYILKNHREDFLSGFAPILDGEAGPVVLMNNPGEYEKYFMVKVKGRGMAENLMGKWTALAAKEKGTKVSDYTIETDIDPHHQVTIYKSPFAEFPTPAVWSVLPEGRLQILLLFRELSHLRRLALFPEKRPLCRHFGQNTGQ